jgi:hypothetical protein
MAFPDKPYTNLERPNRKWRIFWVSVSGIPNSGAFIN